MNLSADPRRRRVRRFANGAAIVLLLIAVGMFVTSWTSPPTQARQIATPTAPVSATPEAAAPATAGPIEVTIGIYLNAIYAIDQQASTYNADFYMWMRWRGDLDPTVTLEMQNNLERWGLTMIQIYDEPKLLPSGDVIQQYHVQGVFFQPLALDDYPLDKHRLTITLEDSTYKDDELVYLVDRESSGIDRNLRIPGWEVTGWEIVTPTHTYDTTFGEEGRGTLDFANLQFTLDIERPQSFFLWKLLLPLIIVLLLGCSVLLVHPSYSEVRLAGPATALLTLIFLQETYTSTLPPNSSLVTLDKIYALAYVLVIGLIVITIITSNWVRRDETSTARAAKLDWIASAALFSFFTIGTAIFLGPLI